MSQAICRTCGIPYNIRVTDHLLTRNKMRVCVPCLWKTADWSSKSLDEKTDESKRKLDEKNAELEDLKSSLTFLRLKSVSQHPDDIQTSDVMIIVEGRTDEPLHAHRFILSSKSFVFRTMFSSNMLEQETGIIHIDDATLPAIRAVINFCYNAEIDFTDEVTAEEVLAVADKYRITLLHQICQKHLIKSLDNSNLAQRLVLATKFEALDLGLAATKYFKSHFDEVIAHVLAELC